jgi:hypothetical protein
MGKTRFSVFALSVLLILTGSVLGNGDDASLKEIAGYRQWTRVYEKPIVVENLGFAAD